jgi:hypothetical protein
MSSKTPHLDSMRELILLCRLARKGAQHMGDQGAVYFAEEKLRIVRRAFITARREAKVASGRAKPPDRLL